MNNDILQQILSLLQAQAAATASSPPAQPDEEERPPIGRWDESAVTAHRELLHSRMAFVPSSERGMLLLELEDVWEEWTVRVRDDPYRLPTLPSEIIPEALDVQALPYDTQVELMRTSATIEDFDEWHSADLPPAVRAMQYMRTYAFANDAHPEAFADVRVGVHALVTRAVAFGARMGYNMTAKDRRLMALRLFHRWQLFAMMFSHFAAPADAAWMQGWNEYWYPVPAAQQCVVFGYRLPLEDLAGTQFAEYGQRLFDWEICGMQAGLLTWMEIIQLLAFSLACLVVFVTIIKSGCALINWLRSTFTKGRLRIRWWWNGKRIPLVGSTTVRRSWMGWGPVNEMSMDGSHFLPTKPLKALVALLIRNDETLTHEFVGFGFRTGLHMVTAMHVWNRLLNAPGAICLTAVKGSMSTQLDMDRVIEITDQQIDLVDVFGRNQGVDDLSYALDCVIFKFEPQFWSKLGVSSVGLADAPNNSPVDAFAYEPPEIKRSSGLVLDSPEAMRIHYSASTRAGSSGCPIMMGTRCVAMHHGTIDNVNRGLASGVIRLIINKTESITEETNQGVYLDRKKGIFRDRYGSEVDVREEDFGYVLVDRKGRRRALAKDDIADYEVLLERLDAGKGSRLESANNLIVGLVQPGSIQIYQDDDQPTVPVARTKSPRRVQTRYPKVPLAINEDREVSVSTPKFSGYNQETRSLVDFDRASELGYDAEAFDFPMGDLRTKTSESFWKHVELFDQAVARTVVPSDDIRRAAKKYCIARMRPASYYMKKNPLSDENISDIINSSLLKDDKSPGRHFISMGLTSNRAVFERYSDKEFAHLVRNLGEPQDIHLFPKLEPHKKKKLMSGMLRLISGCDCRETTLGQAYFGNFNESLADNYQKTPTMVGWSPIAVGGGEYFCNTMNGKKCKFFSSDAETYDWTAYQEWNTDDVSDIILNLAKQPSNMSDIEAVEWKDGAKKVLRRQFTMPFVLPDGTRIERLAPCIMTSGGVLTLGFNTLNMLYMDTVTKLQMGYSVEDLHKLFHAKFGGDDNFQRVHLEFDAEAYQKTFTVLGPRLHEISLTDEFDGSSFFSWEFSASRLGPKWVPTRFTKHLQNILATPTADLADALRSHMCNWAHDEEKFRFFESIWQNLAAKNKRLGLDYPSRSEILDHLLGLEAGNQKVSDVLKQLAN